MIHLGSCRTASCFCKLGLDLDLPDAVVNHPLVAEVEVLSSDLVIIHNDIVSYAKEELRRHLA